MTQIFQITTPSVFFSDLHVTSVTDERFMLLEKFLDSDQAKSSHQIFLLGDIFDLMIGPHESYLHEYKTFFDKIAHYLNQGKIIYYFQGNHDFHIHKLFQLFYKKYKLSKNVSIIDGPMIFHIGEKRIYLAHGDELDIENLPYQRYKKIIRSSFARFLANHLVTKNMLKKIGSYLSKKSKDHQKNFNWNDTFVLYRNYVQKLWDKGIHGVIVGHSHVCDAWEEGVHFYYNVGFAPEERQFLFLNHDGPQFVPLD